MSVGRTCCTGLWLLAFTLASSATPRLSASLSAQVLASEIVSALDSVWVVAIGENHRHVELHGEILTALEDPAVQAVVDDIVVEFGNSLYQPVIDRWVDGEAVPNDSVRMAWQNTVISPNTVWDSPPYATLYHAVRRINQRRTDGRAYRLILGDTPVEWDDVSVRSDVAGFFGRSQSMADAVAGEVLRHGRKALLIAGGAHLTRRNMVRRNRAGVPIAERSVASRIEARFPGTLFIIRSLARSGSLDLSPLRPERGLRFAPTSDPELRGLMANEVSTMRNADGSPFTAYGDATLADLVDAVLLWSADEVSFADAPPETYDDGYWTELNRRSQIVREQPLDPSVRGGPGPE